MIKHVGSQLFPETAVESGGKFAHEGPDSGIKIELVDVDASGEEQCEDRKQVLHFLSEGHRVELLGAVHPQ